ncbi:MAG: L-serine dehydratase [Parachlamydiales bacterium]|nr:L-serine dehydratase [Parachlamydiales bacterium]
MVSVFEIFSIGIGPSSSHTVGPMRAARRFLVQLKEREFLEDVGRVKIDLFGSLAMTGKGHATDLAIIMGLEGETPEHIDPACISERLARIANDRQMILFARHPIEFDPDIDICYVKGKRLPFHSNGMRITAYDKEGEALHTQIYYSVGGGFVVDQQEALKGASRSAKAAPPYPFKTAEELLAHCRSDGLAIWQIVMENEKTWRSEEEIYSGILRIWGAMKDSVQRGLQNRGELPGGLGLRRRAASIFEQLQSTDQNFAQDPTLFMEWVSLFALAVNEENAAGGRIVTAPTNGAAGIIPAVLHYAQKFDSSFSDQKVVIFFLTAAAIAILYKEGASLSAAEMGCQGEIGVASSMAAGGLAAFIGLSNEQIENAAEIGMEHWLGLTCDPVAGLVQIPCIERNAMGAIKAINAARLAMRGDGVHVVSLDAVIRAMRETGENMLSMYKETSEGGLALQISVGIPTC